MDNVTEINSAVKMVQGVDINMAIQIDGLAPFTFEEFDSTRPLIYFEVVSEHVSH